MPAIPYIDLDLEIERTAAGYHAQITNSPSGQAGADFTLPFSDLELENFLLRLGGRRGAARRVESSEMEAAKGFGSKLFSAVFTGDMRSGLVTSQYAAEEQGSGLRIRLRLTNAPELADLPWEYLYNSSLNRFLSLSVKTPLVRYLDLPERIRPLAVEPPLHVLVMISSPTDLTRLDADAEFSRLNQALLSLQQQGLLTLERMDDASLSALTHRLQEGTYHVFHFVGHGAFDASSQDGMLVLEDAEHKGRLVSAQYLGTVLHDHSSLRLAVVNACEGARSSRTDPYSGTAQSLIQQGIPAVIAMQFEITDDAAITFSQEFYGAIARGYPVDGALAEARKAIFAGGNELEWGTPVLYMRAPDGRIFDLQPASPETQKRLQMAAQVHQAQAALKAGDLATAQEQAEAILAREPGQPDAARIAAEAGAQRIRAATYGDALLQLQAKDWGKAIPLLETLSGYRDADALLAQAKNELAQEYAASAAPSSEMPAQPAVPQPAVVSSVSALPAAQRHQPARGIGLKFLGLVGALVILLAAGLLVFQNFKPGGNVSGKESTPTSQPTPTGSAAAALAATVTAQPTSQPPETPSLAPTEQATGLGSASKPIVITFVPSGDMSKITNAVHDMEDLMSKLTGLHYKLDVGTSYAASVEAMGAGKAQVGFLNAFSVLLAERKYAVVPALINVRSYTSNALDPDNGLSGKPAPFYKAQFIANANSGIKTLADLKGKTFCFVDPNSVSGYIIPRITLKANGIDPDKDFKATNFRGSHPNVAIAVYKGDCDAGVTFIDVLTDKGMNLQATYPDITDKVKPFAVADRIPYDGVVYVKDLPKPLADATTKALLDMLQDPNGRAALAALDGINALQRADPAIYAELAQVMQAAGVDPATLVK